VLSTAGSGFRVDDCRPHAEWRDELGRVCMWSTVRAGRPWLVAPGLAAFELDGDVVRAIPFEGGCEEAVEDAFWRSVLPLYLEHRGAQVLHASAVAGPCGVVGLCGRAGAGKSTLAWGLCRRGFRLFADDALVVASIEPPLALALRGELRLLPEVRERFGLVGRRITPELEAGTPAPLVLIIALRPAAAGEAAPAVRRMAAGESFAVLVEHAYVYDLEAGKRGLSERSLELAGGVPVVEVVRPPTLDGLERTVAAVEDLAAGLS
jgi:hypothetical protein